MRSVLLLVFVVNLAGCLNEKFDAEISIVRSSLKDPASAQFEGVQKGKKAGSVCGAVNAKNSYGGYVGFRRFVVFEGVAYVETGEACRDLSLHSSEEMTRMSVTQLERYTTELAESIKCQDDELSLLSKYASLCE